jgi:multiple sugar transport system permease protein
VYPIVLKLSIAFKSRIDMYDPTVLWLPRNFTLHNFERAMEAMNYFAAMKNTLLISTGTTVLQVLSCALAAYGFARLKFKGSRILFAMVIFTIVVPPQTIMIPTYMTYRYFDAAGLVGLFTAKESLNLIDTYWPFIISSSTAMGLKNGLYIYIFTQFFRAVPRELEEAAYVDGYSVPQTFFRIIIPNAVPAIVTVLLFSFVWQWNDSYYVSLFFNKVEMLSTQVLTLGAKLRESDPVYSSMLLNTGALLMIAPLIIMYMFVQRYFVESVERTGLVG